MRKQRIEDAAYEVATQVRAVEDSIEAALIELADLQAKMIHARAATKAGFVATHSAFEQLAVATSSLVAARGGIANCHAALAETRRSIPGLRTVGFGDVGDCPPEAASTLRIVA
jgi:dGTP triphosphohydrolase